MKSIRISAPGKLHLLGEHVVVYNKPAILAAVDKRCFVEITPRKDKKIKVLSRNYNTSTLRRIEEIVEKFEKAQKDWETYNENNDVSLLKSITKDPLDYPQAIVGQFLNYYKIKKVEGFDLVIDSQIPVGSGMGSSGALSVSIIGALSLFAGKPFNKKIINEIAFLAEQKKHGKPSGGDNSTSCYGKLVWFKKDEGIKPLGFGVSEKISKNFYVINTGTPKETTGEMVSRVRDLFSKRELFVQEILDRQEELVKDLKLALEKNIPRQVPGIIKNGERNLQKLGVVSPFVRGLIRKIEESGGAAKICGGGGKTKATGIILIYHTDLQNLKKVLQSHNLNPTQLTLGVEGLRKE
ncbi:MAG: mevalonate kinase [Candidatus Levybacteria bacterium]|nr:mevalonate kinase [Candidatus Levybacteria bacterium]